MVAAAGPLVVKTGQHTGRSAEDKFIVCDAGTEKVIWWEKNKKFTPDQFEALFRAMTAYAQGRDLFAQDLWAGADPSHRIGVRVVTELAWQSLFIQHLLIEPNHGERCDFK